MQGRPEALSSIDWGFRDAPAACEGCVICWREGTPQNLPAKLGPPGCQGSPAGTPCPYWGCPMFLAQKGAGEEAQAGLCRRMKAAAAWGGDTQESPCLGAAPRTSLPPSLPSQLLLTTRTLVDGAGASEFPEEFRSQELRQVWGGGKPDPSRRGGTGWPGTGHRAGHGAEGSRELLLPLWCPCGVPAVGSR